MTLEEHRAAALRQARAIITDPVLCTRRPTLAGLAWALLKKAQGHPILHIQRPAHRDRGQA